MSSQPVKPKTISHEKYRRAAKYVDTALQPVIQRIIDRANEELKIQGIRIGADINWAFDEIAPAKEKDEDDED